ASASPTPRKAVTGRCSGGVLTTRLAAPSAKIQNALDLDSRPARKLRDANRRACRERLRAVGRHDLVDLREMAEVGEEHIDLYRLGQRAARGFGNGFEILEHLVDF